MNTLPASGRIACSRCYPTGCQILFDSTVRTESEWRITANPLAWGNAMPEILVLGFSKGPTQAGALASAPHSEIAYKGSRHNVGKILGHVSLIPGTTDAEKTAAVSKAIADPKGRFHFGSLIRCTVERYDHKKSAWVGSGGGMLDKFVRTPFGRTVSTNCSDRFLTDLPDQAKLVVMFGLGTKLNYVQEGFDLYGRARGGRWSWLNDVSYTDGKIVVVHVEHFASQGALIPNWLGVNNHERSQYGRMAQEAIQKSGVRLT